MKVNRTHRQIANEKLHTNGVVGQTISHELHRIANIHGQFHHGLTPGEVRWLQRKHKEFKDLIDEISEFRRTRLK